MKRMKVLSGVTAIIIMLTLLCGVSPALAAGEFAVITGGSLNMRDEPSYDGSVVDTFKNGTWVMLIEKVSSNWYSVSVDGVYGFMNSRYLKTASDSGTVIVSNPKATQFLNLRESPSYDAKVLAIYYNGAQGTLLRTYTSGWYKVQFGSLVGYMRSEYLKSAGGEGTATVNLASSSKLNMRSGPSYDDSVIKTFRGGTVVNVLLKGNTFWKVSVDGYTGYMASSMLSTGGSSESTAYVSTGNSGRLNLRQLPVYDDDNIIAQLSNGTRLTIIETGTNWSRVKVVSSGLTGYVRSSMISYGSVSSDTKTVVQPKGLYVNLRSGPDYGYKVVCRMPTGAKITVISKGKQWSKVKYGSYTGYMVNDFIK
ncbi:MAG: SH3 domain-containing protein [Eubacteriales bacterium]|nr:SH3 domain-containing protein [Eubacteriales bacterium]MDD3882029.1 SH3 domain-containing protein [Eubacteriales bacterium]MDD4512476.1 SH3 domain-containing protein [Eubacteriales bacterium]